MLEDAEDGTSAATHCCVYGTEIVKALLDFGKLRMHRKDRSLEIIDKLFLPGLDRLTYDVSTALGWLLRSDGCIGILGAHGNVITLYNNDVIALHVVARTAYRHQYIANSLSVAGSIAILRVGRDEEGTVGTQLGCISLHLGIADVETEPLIQQTNHVGSIRRTATHTSLRRNTLHEMGMNAGNLEVGSNHIVCLHHEILLLIAIYCITCYLEIAWHIARKLFAHELDFQRIC